MSILGYRNKLWIRKDTRDSFDILKRSSYSADATDVVGMYLVYELDKLMPETDGGLYRDDAFLLLENQLENYTKNFIVFLNLTD